MLTLGAHKCRTLKEREVSWFICRWKGKVKPNRTSAQSSRTHGNRTPPSISSEKSPAEPGTCSGDETEPLGLFSQGWCSHHTPHHSIQSRCYSKWKALLLCLKVNKVSAGKQWGLSKLVLQWVVRFNKLLSGDRWGCYWRDCTTLMNWCSQHILVGMWHLKMDGIASLGFPGFSCVPPLAAAAHH